MTDLATPFDVESYCSTDADSLSRDLDSFRSTTPELLTSTIGRLVTLLDHDATDLSSLVSLVLDLTGDSPQDLETVSSHHTLSDVRSILLRTPVSCRIELICGAGREADGVRRLVGKWQDRSIRANLLLLSSKDAWGEEKRRDQGWEQVVDEFEQKGLSPSDFWAVKSCVPFSPLKRSVSTDGEGTGLIKRSSEGGSPGSTSPSSSARASEREGRVRCAREGGSDAFDKVLTVRYSLDGWVLLGGTLKYLHCSGDGFSSSSSHLVPSFQPGFVARNEDEVTHAFHSTIFSARACSSSACTTTSSINPAPSLSSTVLTASSTPCACSFISA